MLKRILLLTGISLSCLAGVLAGRISEKGFLKEGSETAFLLPPPPPMDTFIYDTVSIVAGTIVNRCLDTTELTGPVDTVYNICPNANSTIVSFVTNSKCVKYQGLSCGTDTACIVICDVNGVCDTTYLVVSALDPDCYAQKSIFHDTIFVNTDDDYCLDLSELNGNLAAIENDCPASSGESVVFSIDATRNCINYSAIAVGTDTACIIMRDDRGFADTVCIIITGKIPRTDTICDTLQVDDIKMYCITNEELDGNIVSFENICPQSSGISVQVILNPITLCLEVTANALGTDTICMVICDNFDVCDTTIFKITVIPADTPILSPPIAVKDFTSTPKDSPLVYNVLANDTIPGGPVSLEIVESPRHGIIIVNVDFTVTYVPDFGFCGSLDTFEYRVCNQDGCDTALVCINVECGKDTLIIYNGISPDNDPDGINENFTIEGIEKYPGNKVKIFNRWGNLVFEEGGYRNTWNGTWNDKDLPDGTYFYLLDLGDGRIFKGYLQINR